MSAFPDTPARAERRLTLRSNAIVPLVVMTGAALVCTPTAGQPVDEGTRASNHQEIRATLSSARGGWPDIDTGTRVVARYDYRSIMEGTTLTKITVEGPLEPFKTASRMARIRALAPLSFRDWAPVFEVSHTRIKQWADGEEPDRPKLDRILNALSEASVYHRDMRTWLTTVVPGMDVRPLDLLRDERWRAYRGAIRARSAPAVTVPPEELMRRRRVQSSWVMAEPPVVTDEA
jgi:hypothetical protein